MRKGLYSKKKINYQIGRNGLINILIVINVKTIQNELLRKIKWSNLQ